MEKEQSGGKLPPGLKCEQEVKLKNGLTSIGYPHLHSLDIEVVWTVSKMRRRKPDGIMLYGIKFNKYIDPNSKMNEYMVKAFKSRTYMMIESLLEPVFDLEAVLRNLDTLERKME